MERGGNYEQPNYQYERTNKNNYIAEHNHTYTSSVRRIPLTLDAIALLLGIISIITCSGCFMLGFTGVIISLIVLLDNTGKYTKTKAILGLIFNSVSIIFMILIVVGSNNSMPNLCGVEPTEAITMLENMNNEYIIQQEEEFSNTITKGLIVRTYPTSGEKLQQGAVITLYVSRGKAISIPDLNNVNVEDAVSIINNLGLNVDIQEQNSDNIEEGKVISTEPSAHDTVEEGSTVIIVKSLGASIIMPDIIGIETEQAEEILKELGIQINKEAIFSEFPINTVISTNYTAGDKIDNNSVVTITVSKGTKEQEIMRFKDACESPSYDDLIRNPTKYSEVPIKLTVKIDKLESEKFLGIEYDKAIWATYNGETIILRDDREVPEPALRVGDKVTIYGYGDGTDTIQTKQKEYQGSLVFGFSYNKTVDEYEVPSMKIYYIEF